MASQPKIGCHTLLHNLSKEVRARVGEDDFSQAEVGGWPFSSAPVHTCSKQNQSHFLKIEVPWPLL